jgi:hypothetical protein
MLKIELVYTSNDINSIMDCKLGEMVLSRQYSLVFIA